MNEKSDAPKAPAGWYPKPDGQDGMRYWTGETWQEESNAVPAKAPQPSSSTTTAVGWAVGILIALMIIAIAASSASNANNSASSSSSTSKQSAPTLPEGFRDLGGGLAYKNSPEGKCSYFECAQAFIYAYKDCPGGVYVEVNLKSPSGVIYDMSNDMLGAMKKGDIAIADFTFTKKTPADSKYEITKSNCL